MEILHCLFKNRFDAKMLKEHLFSFFTIKTPRALAARALRHPNIVKKVINVPITTWQERDLICWALKNLLINTMCITFTTCSEYWTYPCVLTSTSKGYNYTFTNNNYRHFSTHVRLLFFIHTGKPRAQWSNQYVLWDT